MQKLRLIGVVLALLLGFVSFAGTSAYAGGAGSGGVGFGGGAP